MRFGALFAMLAVGSLLVVGTGAAAERPKAPPIVGKTLAGKKLSLAKFRGKPVLINVWSSW